jgi:ribonuclease D
MPGLPSPILVQTPAAWRHCLAELRQQPRLAVDTESNSLHAYQEQVCLIQVSVPGRDYVIDPLSLPDLEGLGGLMADPALEKVFHAAEYDLLCMKRDFGYQFAGLFDTMLAARILGWDQLGLGSILEQEFGIKVNKRFQRANWGRRPLPPEQIEYASLDSHYLLALRDRLGRELTAAGRAAEARASFARVAGVTPTPHAFDPDAFWGLLNGRRLAPQQNAVLRELYVFRDREAQRRNLPVFKVFANRTLVELAEALPRRVDELEGMYGLTSRVVSRYGRGLVGTVRRGLRAKPPEPPRRRARPPSAAVARFEELRAWRKRRAGERGVESDVIVSREALWELARGNSRSAAELVGINALDDWQRREYGQELLGVLDRTRREG